MNRRDFIKKLLATAAVTAAAPALVKALAPQSVPKLPIIEIPNGRRFHAVWLELGDGMEVSRVSEFLDGITIKVNGRVQHRFSVEQLEDFRQLTGSGPAGAGVVFSYE